MNTLKEKWGPLPVWAWLALITAAGLAWWLVSRNRGTSTAAAPGGVPSTVILNQQPAEDEQDEDQDRDRKGRHHPKPKPKRKRKPRDRDKDEDHDRDDRKHRDRDRDGVPRSHLPTPPVGRGPANHTPPERERQEAA